MTRFFALDSVRILAALFLVGATAPIRAATVRESPMALRATKPDEAANCRSNGINDLGGVFRGAVAAAEP